LLERHENRCGEPRVVETIGAAFDESVPVPDADDSIVLARFGGINDQWADRVRTALFRAPEFFVDIGDAVPRRVVPDTERSWHVVRAPECVTALLDGQPNPETLRFSTDASDFGGSRSVTVEYAVVPFEC
jgi:hypothetical protein